MLRRLILTFSLIALFGLAQFGAVTHELSHYYSDATAQNQQQDYNDNSGQNNKNNPNNLAPHNKVCEKCVSYAELGNAVSSTHAVLPLAITTNLLIISRLQTFSHIKSRTYLARAPPTLA